VKAFTNSFHHTIPF